MNWYVSEGLFEQIIDKDFGIGIFDEAGLLKIHSPNLRTFLLNPNLLHPILQTHITELFPELVGLEADLAAIKEGQEKTFTLDHVFRPSLYGKPGYISLRVKDYQAGWLIIIRNTTSHGVMEQKITQQRNQLTLLSDELEKTRSKMDRLLRTFVPNAVVDDLLKRNTINLGGERRVVTILFADLRGYTAWAEKHTPEDALSGLNQLLSKAFDILNDNGATINQLMGDGFMSIFNAPLDQPRHAFLALESARQIAKLPGLDKHVLFGVGINTGLAMTGNVGSKRAMDYSAIGTTTNIAYRLQQLAGPGEALFGEKTHELAGNRFRHMFHGAYEVKGINTPIPVYRLME